jgi:hypothetical protein
MVLLKVRRSTKEFAGGCGQQDLPRLLEDGVAVRGGRLT